MDYFKQNKLKINTLTKYTDNNFLPCRDEKFYVSAINCTKKHKYKKKKKKKNRERSEQMQATACPNVRDSEPKSKNASKASKMANAVCPKCKRSEQNQRT